MNFCRFYDIIISSEREKIPENKIKKEVIEMYERYWLITINRNGFETKALVYGTETEMQEYMTYECGYVPAYRGATEAEVKAAKSIGMKAYTA